MKLSKLCPKVKIDPKLLTFLSKLVPPLIDNSPVLSRRLPPRHPEDRWSTDSEGLFRTIPQPDPETAQWDLAAAGFQGISVIRRESLAKGAPCPPTGGPPQPRLGHTPPDTHIQTYTHTHIHTNTSRTTRSPRTARDALV